MTNLGDVCCEWAGMLFTSLIPTQISQMIVPLCRHLSGRLPYPSQLPSQLAVARLRVDHGARHKSAFILFDNDLQSAM